MKNNDKGKRFSIAAILIALLFLFGGHSQSFAQDSFESDDLSILSELSDSSIVSDSTAQLTLNLYNSPDLLTEELSSNYKKRRRGMSEPLKIILIYTGSIVLNAVGDGLNDSDRKNWGHVCNAASIGLLVTSPFIIDYDRSKWGWYLTSYVFLRITFFDWTYNLTRELPLDYIGTSNWWDKGLNSFGPYSTAPIRLVSGIVGIHIPIGQIGNGKNRSHRYRH